jgi:hypothetical protein
MPATYGAAHRAASCRRSTDSVLKAKQIVVAATRKPSALCLGVLKTGKRFDPTIAMGC